MRLARVTVQLRVYRAPSGAKRKIAVFSKCTDELATLHRSVRRDRFESRWKKGETRSEQEGRPILAAGRGANYSNSGVSASPNNGPTAEECKLASATVRVERHPYTERSETLSFAGSAPPFRVKLHSL